MPSEKKRICMGLSDIYTYASNHKTENDYVTTDEEVIIQVPTTLYSSNDETTPLTEGLYPFVGRAYHDQRNLNDSRIERTVFKEKTPSIKFRPILANIVEDEDGVMDFGSHDFEYDEDGNCIYYEHPVGVITSYAFEDDAECNVTRAIVNGFLFSDYQAEAAEIMKRRKKVDCSVELIINDMHFDKEDVLVLDDYYVGGLTLLGAKHAPGMAGSYVEAFEGHSMDSAIFKYLDSVSDDMIEKIRQFEESLKDEGKKGGKMNTEDKADFNEAEDEKPAEDPVVAEEETPETPEEPAEESAEETVPEEGPEADEQEDDAEFEQKPVEFSRTLSDKENLVYRSLIECLRARNNEYSWLENLFIFDGFVAFQSEETRKWEIAEWSETEETVSVNPDSIQECWVEFIPLSEKEARDADYSNLASQLNVALSRIQELEAYKNAADEATKDQILNDVAYEKYVDQKAFADLKQNRANYSLDDFKVQCELAFAKCAREDIINQRNGVRLPLTNEKDSESVDSRYGSFLKG